MRVAKESNGDLRCVHIAPVATRKMTRNSNEDVLALGYWRDKLRERICCIACKNRPYCYPCAGPKYRDLKASNPQLSSVPCGLSQGVTAVRGVRFRLDYLEIQRLATGAQLAPLWIE